VSAAEFVKGRSESIHYSNSGSEEAAVLRKEPVENMA
jgi:hypothetical protein